MDAVGKMLDEAEKLAEKAKTAIKAALADEDSRCLLYTSTSRPKKVAQYEKRNTSRYLREEEVE